MIHTISQHSSAFVLALTTGGTFAALNVISGESVIPLQEALSVMAIIIPVIWWFSRKFQKIDDSLEAINKRLDGLPYGHKCEEKT